MGGLGLSEYGLDFEGHDSFRAVDLGEDLFFKARPATEGAERYLWIEPSREVRDSEREVVRREAVVAAWPFYQKFGNIDREHWTMRPPPGTRAEDVIKNEIGKPVDFYPQPLVLKARLYRGSSEFCEQANLVWQMLEAGAQLYPSMGGQYLDRECSRDGCIVKSFLWRNTALAQEPVNKAVSPVSMLPLNDFLKSVTSGYATDSAGMTGGRAIQLQSMQRGVVSNTPEYSRLAVQYLRGLGSDACPHTKLKPTAATLAQHFRECGGFDHANAKAAAARLLKQVAARVTHNEPAAAAA